MGPAWERLDAVEPGSDVLVARGDVETELLRRVIEVADQRKVGDGRLSAYDKGPGGEPLVEYPEYVVDPSLEEFQHRRMAGRFGQRAQKRYGPR